MSWVFQARLGDMKSIVVAQPKSLTLGIMLGMAIFTIPLLLAGPQLIVGTIVNALLVIIATKTASKYWLPLAMLPSLGAFMHGVLFGPLTFLLLYFLPMIWVGNLLYMKVVTMNFGNWPLVVRVIAAASFKAALLFFSARIYHAWGIVPAMFLVAMGINQWFTAMAGGILGKVALKKI